MRNQLVIFLCITSINYSPTKISFTGERVQLNQAGFYIQGPKVAVVTGDVYTRNFYVIRANSSDTAYKGELSDAKHSQYSSTQTKIADFTPLKTGGSYFISVPGAGDSYVFEINNGIHHAVSVATLKGFYYQRVSMPLEARYAGKWSREAGHPDTHVLIHSSAASTKRPVGTVISSPGGWYDAGDYNKYIVNSGITMGTLLSAYEDFPGYYDTLHTDIPESHNNIPDILDEILYNLRWMITMQDPFDGGVYHKCTNAAFDGMVMPGVTKAPRYVVQKGTAATLDFAAVMAQAARVLKKFNRQLPRLSDTCLKAATKAWQWAEKNPAVIYDQDQINRLSEPRITTGAYGDRKFSDEKFWAAAELFVTTRNKKFYPSLLAGTTDSITLPSWGNVGMLGCYTLLRHKDLLPRNSDIDVNMIKDKIIRLADSYISHASINAFNTVMGQSRRDFIWGSNSVAANQGIVLINAYLLTKEVKYIHHALTNLDYIMGRNATGYCFVTGIGSKSPMHPHHRPSVADGIVEPVPGLLAGGPNPGRQDSCHYDFTEPETAYSDTDCSYASNEIAINWNAPMVYLANALEALQGEL